jgi:3-oxoacyl-(acyl-carrier-protein) synthase
MFIKDYSYLKATEHYEDRIAIPELTREGYATKEFMSLIDAPKLTKRTAVLFVGGFGIHQSESRRVTTTNPRHVGSVDYQPTSLITKEGTAYSMHQWIGAMENNHLVVHASINTNTCASAMHSIYEAEQLLKSGVAEEVIVIAEERTSFNTLRIFKEHRIPLTCSDGFAMVTFTMEPSKLEVTDTKWFYSYDRNPFKTTTEAYAIVDTDKPIDQVKPHGTRTPINDVAETELVKDRKAIYYKDLVGHSQGTSALLELCMLAEDADVSGSTLCVASGFGGFYGSCILHKH